MTRTWQFLLLVYGALALSFGALPANAAPVNCDQLKKYGPQDSAKIDPALARKCTGSLGGDPPSSLQVNDGQNAGNRAAGSTGISYGTATSPEVTGATRKAPASATKARINFGCSFPPRIQFSFSSGIKVGGSCLDFFKGLLKDKANPSAPAVPVTPPPYANPNVCTAEADTTGMFGSRSALKTGAMNLSCGGMVPLTTTDMVLTSHANGLAITLPGEYAIYIYRKVGNSYSAATTPVKTALPTHLCREISVTDTGALAMEKSVDLTPPVGEMITYNSQAGFISVRLKSRENMDPGFVPPYDSALPEKYLIIPLDASGNPTVPANCAKESDYYQANAGQQDILVHSSTMSGCEGVSVMPTQTYNPTANCPSGTTVDPMTGKCLDSNNKVVPAIVDYHPITECPSGAAPVNNQCPEVAQLPASMASCATSGNSANDNCTTSSVQLDASVGPTCAGKTQYSVLNRPNLYYPVGAAPAFSSVGAPFTYFLADTVANTKFFTQPQTSIFLQATAPAVTLSEGGMVRFSDNTKLIVQAETIVDIAGKKITMPNGGQLVDIGANELHKFKENESYAIPAGAITFPIEVNVNSSFTLPAGYSVPTAPQVDALAPYVRTPAAAAPQ